MISIRSIWLAGMRDHAMLPEVAEPTRIPSISSRAWLPLVPRISRLDTAPRLPLAVSSMPGWLARISSRLEWPAASISVRSMTLVSVRISLVRIACRVAVTTTVSSAASCSAAWVDSANNAGSRAASGFKRGFMNIPFSAGVPACRNALTRKYAGERAGQEPAPPPRGTSARCARPVSGLASLDVSPSQVLPSGFVIRPHLLTVAGAAAA